MPELQARLYRVATIRWVDLPRRAVARLGTGKQIPALLRFNDDVDRVTLLPGKRGHYKLAIKVELLRSAGVDAGDVIRFALTPDTASREPDLPAEMQRAFLARPQLATAWGRETLALRRQIVRYIEQAKSPETRARRSWILIERLADTGTIRTTGAK
jgi:hypothetical protein